MSLKRPFIKKRILFFILLSIQLLFLQNTIAAPTDEVNYCTDKESWKEWDELVAKYPADEDIQILHALRLGLCAKVSRGDITVQQATDIFEKARGIIIVHKKETAKKDKKI